MMVTVGLPAVSQPPESLRKRAIVGDDGSAVAERAKILGRVEAERARDPDRADGTPPCRREVRLTAVFDDREIVPGGDRFDPRHGGGLAVQVHREDRAGART